MKPITPTANLDPEVIYAAIAEAIDRAGPEREILLLTRLGLLLGCQATNEGHFLATLAAAENDLHSHQP